jgi:5,10-methylenetetrahydrofolate reductase
MDFYAEIQPSRFREKIDVQLNELRGLVRRLHIPDAPMGYPKAAPLSIASIAVSMGYRVTLHIRTMDYNHTGLLNILYGSLILGVDKTVFLRGDKPVIGLPCNLLSTEDALQIYWREQRLREKIAAGVILSLNYPIKKIIERLDNPYPSFYLLLNKDIRKAEMIRRATDKELVGYFIIQTEKNKEMTSRMSSRDTVPLHDLNQELSIWSRFLDSVLLTAPGDARALSSALYSLKI